MSMEDKAVFLKQLEAALGERLTAAELNKALCAVSDTLEGYELTARGEHSDEQDDLLGAFLTAMQIQGRSAKTVDRYVYIIRRMLRGVNASTRQVTVYHLRRYLAEERERGISDRTLEGYRQVFSSYFNWLQREGLISKNPVSNLGAIKCLKKVKETYNEVDIEKLKLHCRTLRDRAILCFLMSTGCRISEMIQLDRDSIDFSSLEVKVLGKGNKERNVFLDPVAGMTIRQYLITRTDDSPALFTGKGTERLKPGEIPVWRQPTGAQDAYQTGDKVHYPAAGDPVYVSTCDNNVWAPGVYGWELVSE